MKMFASKLQVNEINLNDFQHGYLTSTPNLFSKIKSTIL